MASQLFFRDFSFSNVPEELHDLLPRLRETAIQANACIGT